MTDESAPVAVLAVAVVLAAGLVASGLLPAGAPVATETPAAERTPGDPGGSGAHGTTGDAGSADAPGTPGGAVGVLHDRGLTGEGVSIGVVDVTGYAVERSRLDGRVTATATFGDGDPRSGGRYTHGTAAAATAAAVAPGAELYLTTATTPAAFRRAVRWLLDRDVDVVVAPVSFYGQPDDGRSAVAAAAARAADRGVVFVAPTGNLARRHWDGRDDGPGRRLSFGDDTRNGLEGDAGRLVVWLSWDRRHRDADFTALLYREDPGGAHLVARSEPYSDDVVPNERITATLEPDGRYFVVVRGPDRATGARVELESPTHRLDHHRARGSIAAPATARDVLVVGASDRGGDRPVAYSSRGPTRDGRPAVDVVAPAAPLAGVDGEAYRGTSLSASYVAGVAALLLSGDAGLAPGRVEQALELTASDVGPPGYDLASGFGRVAPVEAAGQVGVARNDTPTDRPTAAG